MIDNIDILRDKINKLEQIVIKQTEEKYIKGEFTGAKKEEYENNIGDLLNLKNDLNQIIENEKLNLADEYIDVITLMKEDGFSSKNAVILYNKFRKSLKDYLLKDTNSKAKRKERIDHILNKITINISK